MSEGNPAAALSAGLIVRRDITHGFWCPFPVTKSPHIDRARRAMLGWAARFGIVTDDHEARWLARWQPEQLVGRVYASCAAEDLELAACWFAWLFIVDDSLDVSTPHGVPQQVARITAILRRDDPGLAGADASPVVKALADLWDRTRRPMSAAWRARAAYSFTRCLDNSGWEAGNRETGRTPGIDAYHDARRWGGGTYFCLDLLERFQHFELTDDLVHCGPYEALRLYACDHIDWVNDVISVDRETTRGDLHNLVPVLQHAHGYSETVAIQHVITMANERVRTFRVVEGHVLPAYIARARLPAQQRDLLYRGVAGLRQWMSGSLDWHLTTHRYRDHTHPAGNPFAGASTYWARTR